MDNITGERDFFKFYLVLLGACCFFLIMALAIGGIFINDYYSDHFMTKEYFALVMVAALIVGFFYSIYRFFKVAPSIEIDIETLKLNNNIYYWKDLEKIELTGKRPFILGEIKEGVLLKFKNQDELYFLDLYENSPAIKQFIQTYIIDKQQSLSTEYIGQQSPGVTEQQPQTTADIDLPLNSSRDNIQPIPYPEIENEDFKVYKNVQFFNFRGIVFWGFIFMVFLTSVQNGDRANGWLFSLVCSFGMFRMLVWFTYYFKMSANFFVIRNHNAFWYKKIYLLSDIREVVFEQHGRAPYGMRVITNDFESKLFYGATLWKKQWRALRDDLKEKGILVKDEFIFNEVEVEFTVFDDLGWFKKKK
jgi:hypothetical protein